MKIVSEFHSKVGLSDGSSDKHFRAFSPVSISEVKNVIDSFKNKSSKDTFDFNVPLVKIIKNW